MCDEHQLQNIALKLKNRESSVYATTGLVLIYIFILKQ